MMSKNYFSINFAFWFNASYICIKLFIMKRFIIISVLFLSFTMVYGVNPAKEYRYTPSDYKMVYNQHSILTSDGYKLNAWSFPQKDTTADVALIAYGDAGNMGEWLGMAYLLNSMGMEVWMFDYRGFGHSDEFATQRSVLVYDEFYNDFESVVKYVYNQNNRPIILCGISMGTILVNRLLKQGDYSDMVKACILDGFITDVNLTISRLNNSGKNVIVPDIFTKMKNDMPYQLPMFIIHGTNDRICKVDDYSTIKNNSVTLISLFNNGHIQSLFDNYDLLYKVIY